MKYTKIFLLLASLGLANAISAYPSYYQPPVYYAPPQPHEVIDYSVPYCYNCYCYKNPVIVQYDYPFTTYYCPYCEGYYCYNYSDSSVSVVKMLACVGIIGLAIAAIDGILN